MYVAQHVRNVFLEDHGAVCTVWRISDVGGKTVVPTTRGRDSINKASKERGHAIVVSEGQAVHEECRRNFTNKRCIQSYLRKQQETESATSMSQSLRSQNIRFNFARCCLFCGNEADVNARNGPKVHPVRTLDFQNTIAKVCSQRGDEWAHIVKSRLEFVSDLPAADAVYHQTCSLYFRGRKRMPPKSFASDTDDKRIKLGRPKDERKADAFDKVASFFNANDNEQITVNDLINKMKEYTGGDAYSHPKMKEELQKHFGEELIITEINGKSNVVTFRRTASSILHSFYSKEVCDEKSQKRMIIETAAQLIKSEIKSLNASRESYPSPDDIASLTTNLDVVPESLQLMLRTIFSEKDVDLKVVSIGQAIMQAARPRILICPMQIGLAVQLHHCFRSKFLVETLYSLGFSSSYNEVLTFEINAAASANNVLTVPAGHYTQFMADNVDHNTATLDGLNTFHGMGIIASATPGVSSRMLVRRRTDVKIEDIVEKAKIDIRYYREEYNGLMKLKFENLQTPLVSDLTSEVDLLWKACWLLNPRRPSWSGVMQTVHHGEFPGQSSIIFMPMIDMNPSDKTCIYSTLHFVCATAKCNKTTPVLTFDQPLWWKALSIIMSEPDDSDLHSIVLRLCPFHLQMSFLACIGHLMEETGLHDALSTVYAPNAVNHMLQGKAVLRAVRGHFLVDAALNALLMSETFRVPLPHPECESGINEPEEHSNIPLPPTRLQLSFPQTQVQTDGTAVILDEELEPVPKQDLPRDVEGIVSDVMSELEDRKDLEMASSMFDKMLKGELSPGSVNNDEHLIRISKKLYDKKMALTGRTTELWLQYMSMVDILKRFLKAERTGNWLLHLSVVSEMLPYLAAAGHNLYAKSGYLYLQQMTKLNVTNPVVYKNFIDGHHVVRRSNRFWAGISSDLAIEQTLMRSVKTSGGLTRGTGITESQRAKWVLSMPACADMNNAMQEVTGTTRLTSDQHIETGSTRTAKDMGDMMLITSYLLERNPFADDPTLRNIATGVVGDSSVNVDKAKTIGLAILKTMEGQTAAELTLKKKDQVKTLGAKQAVKVDGNPVFVDPQLLFQRFITAANTTYDDTKELFRYELCSFPSSLFETPDFLRQPNKAALADELWKLVLANGSSQSPSVPNDVQFVIDGGSLLQRLQAPWRRGNTFQSIINSYAQFVNHRYHKAVVVFDGYMSGPSTKDMTHLRRSKGRKGCAVHFVPDMMLRSTKDQFLANEENKQRFIFALGASLEKTCTVIYAKSDADLQIVFAAIECAKHDVTAVVGEDTDLLVLLAHHFRTDSHEIFFYSDKQAKNLKVWSMKQLTTALGDLRHLLLFFHAFTGCDTTSRPFGIGKAVALKKLKNSPEFQALAGVFLRDNSFENVESAGERVLVRLYNGSPNESLNELRYRLFCSKVAVGTTFVQVHTLPPTSAATRFHSLRVYFQVQEWLGNKLTVEPTQCGWKRDHDSFVPVTTDLPAAPEDLLKVIRCMCKNNCDTKRCSCRKHGLDCTYACGECSGVSCSNSSTNIAILD